MNLKLPTLVAFLCVMLVQQISYAQNGCAPTGSNTSTHLLNFVQIGGEFEYTVPNAFRYNLIKEGINFDSNSIPVQLNFTNPNGDTYYVGMYLDFNQNASYSYSNELIYEVATSATEYSGTMNLTNAQLNAMGQNNLWFRIIVTKNHNELVNTCLFPSVTKPYQVFETRTRKLKIKKSTANGGCQQGGVDMRSVFNMTNGYPGDVIINQVQLTLFQGPNSCESNSITYSEMPSDPQLAADGTVYNWIPAEEYFMEQNNNYANFVTDIMSDCWNPPGELTLQVDVDFMFEVLPFGNYIPDFTSETIYYRDIIVCPPGGGAGGGDDPKTRLQSFEPTQFSVYPNPITAECIVKLELLEKSQLNIRIVNLQGETVYNSNDKRTYPVGEHSIPVRTDNLPLGSYFIEVVVNEKTKFMERLVKIN